MSILCPTDFSVIATQAAEVASVMARRFGLSLRLVHSFSPWASAAEGPIMSELEERARGALAAEAGRLRATGVTVVADYRVGSAAKELAAAVGAGPVEMVVMGATEPVGGLGGWLVSSVAEALAEDVPVPTLVVRRPEVLAEWLEGGRPLRILWAADFTVASEGALAALKKLSVLGPLEIEAAHVVGAGEVPGSESGVLSPEEETSLKVDVWQRLHEFFGEVPVQIHVRVASSGHEAGGLIDLAGEVAADLVVVGARQVRGLRRLVDSSFSRGVLAQAPMNVLCVPVASYVPDFKVRRVERVVAAVDFSSGDALTLAHACGLVAGGGAVRILHVCAAPSLVSNPAMAAGRHLDSGQWLEEARMRAEGRMRLLEEEVAAAAPGLAVTCEVVIHADPAAAICEAAERSGGDVICLGSRGASRLGAALLGSVAQGVVARARQPVLVVPPRRS